MENKKLIIVSITITVIVIGFSWALSGSGGSSTSVAPQRTQTASVDETKITLGEPESTHEHMTVLAFVDGERVNFNQDKYMLKDRYVHFEDNDGAVIHKHATGVTLPYFLLTLGVELTQNCITLDTSRQYCNLLSENKVLRIIVNGQEVKNVDAYELRHKDKILINYGDDNETELQLKFNNIPNVPIELL